MSNLKLITTEKFGELDCKFYRNMNDDILLTREQIGTALEYSAPSKAIRKIHLKHKDRLEPLCIRIKLQGGIQNGANLKSEEQERVYYSQRGIMEICRWSRQQKANEFMDWVWTVIEKYRNGELQQQIDINPIVDTLNKFTNTVYDTLSTINDRITKIEEQQKHIPINRIFSSWTSKMFPKYKLLNDYFDIGNKELYHNLFIELENTYPDVDLNQEKEDYCFENGLDNCFLMDVIEHNKTLRHLFECIVDNILDKYNLSYDNQIQTRRKTIFDE